MLSNLFYSSTGNLKRYSKLYALFHLDVLTLWVPQLCHLQAEHVFSFHILHLGMLECWQCLQDEPSGCSWRIGWFWSCHHWLYHLRERCRLFPSCACLSARLCHHGTAGAHPSFPKWDRIHIWPLNWRDRRFLCSNNNTKTDITKISNY